MDWQQVLSLVIVACTAMLLVGGRIRRRRASRVNCGSNCSCMAAPATDLDTPD